MTLTLTVTNQTRRKVNLRRLKGRLGGVLGMLGIKRGSWAVTLVGDRAMRQLHGRTMGMATTTDVLTFDLRDDGARGGALDLDTVICVDEARRQAAGRGHAVEDEVLLYAVHSLLHVRGYDDDTAGHAARMHRREDAILTKLGVGAVYHAAVGRPPKGGTPNTGGL